MTDCPIYQDFLRACTYPWATPEVRNLADVYANDTLTTARAAGKARKLQSAVFNASTPRHRGAARRHYLHALARWWAAILRESYEANHPVPDFTPVYVVTPTSTASITSNNRVRRAHRAQRHADLVRMELQPLLTKYAAAKAECERCLIEKRRADLAWERALLQARKLNPEARAPRDLAHARVVATQALAHARTERKAIQVEVRKLKQTIAGWESRSKRILSGRQDTSRDTRLVEGVRA